ncbi:hypothetical protein [Actinocrispum wychmicini]|uniref:Uncharacterized protein n=1 Tax=Actinocrispum wychmicini TaxID=1213861 RepID=A0A4R2JC48_9PSEU|nr:hypothetical protein [Actinocrispum wychmicini]TCO57103.1 hypothetical protein EV192_106580 [Actinocrispum wychmicini]
MADLLTGWYLPVILEVLAPVGIVSLCVFLALVIKRLKARRARLAPSNVHAFPTSAMPSRKIRQLRHGR